MDIRLENTVLTQGDFTLRADIAINAGQTTAVIGPSGGGKSTLLMVIAGFLTPQSGQILLGEKPMQHSPPAARPVSVLFQENNLFPHLSVFKNTALGIDPNLKLSAAQKDQVFDALDRVGLRGRDNDMPANLSGGQRQRVALARALLRDKPIWLLDEPFAALGPALRHEMLDLVAEIREAQNATVLLVTHNPDDALRISAKTVLVADGVAYAPQGSAELLANPPKILSDYLGVDHKKGR